MCCKIWKLAGGVGYNEADDFEENYVRDDRCISTVASDVMDRYFDSMEQTGPADVDESTNFAT